MNGWGRKDAQVRKRVFLRHLYINAMILPRQARDKHRESTQKETRFPTGVSLGGKSLAKDVAFSLGSPWAEVPAKQETFDFTDTGAKSLFLGVV